MTTTIVIGSSKIDVTLDPASWRLSEPQLLHWVQQAAEAVTTYYGRYPRPHVRVHILPSSGHGVGGGMTWGREGGVIRIRVGSETSAEELSEDWMLTHEMVHLAFPSMEDQHHWIEEGLATYVEPIARIQAGQMSADSMWADLVRDMPKGQPQEGDRGLDHTHTWGRTYWGGALFSLVADVAIRKKTGNRKGLQDAMRGILENGGDITEDWPIESALKAGDQAVGVQVLVPLYSEWKDQPVHVDLAALWTELGIDAKANPIRMDDKAPSAEIRRAITSSGPHKPSAESARERSVIAGRKLGPIY
jgi:predicted metalloprotease with PDZ domain